MVRIAPALRVALVLLLGMLHALAARAAPPPDPGELARGINAAAVCTRRVVLGPCFCGPLPCGAQVLMYVPVAYVEVVRAPGDALIAAPPGATPGDAAGTVSSSDAALDHTAETRVWLIGDSAWTLAAQPPCLQCKPSHAWAPAPAPAAPLAAGCDPAQAVAQAVLGSAASAAGGLLPSLAYASELDAVNWRTGCRDLLAMDAWVGSLAGALGSWGSLYPRQMRDLGTAQPVYSAKTAYRAMSIARDQLGTFPFPLDPSGLMQQAYPAVSECFAVGEPLSAPASSRGAQVSPDARYGWFYWRPVTCCIGQPSLAHCAAGSTR